MLLVKGDEKTERVRHLMFRDKFKKLKEPLQISEEGKLLKKVKRTEQGSIS